MTAFRVELPDGLVLDGELTTVALAFLMHEYAPIAMYENATLRALAEGLGRAGEEPEAAVDGVVSSDGELAPELDDPEAFADGAYREIGDDDGSGNPDE